MLDSSSGFIERPPLQSGRIATAKCEAPARCGAPAAEWRSFIDPNRAAWTPTPCGAALERALVPSRQQDPLGRCSRDNMGYPSLQACVADLERHGHLIRIEHEIDPHLEVAAIQRRVYAAGGPALLFTRVKGCRFPLLSNLFGTLPRARFVFRDALSRVGGLIALKADPGAVLRHPLRYLGVPWTALHALPTGCRRAPVLACESQLSALPQITSWPKDGGPFITLPQVYSEDPRHPGPQRANLGMYRVQLAGNEYASEREVGLHYQIHRGIGVHHSLAAQRGERLPVNIFVGGPPALSLSAVMPLPEGLPELFFAGALGMRRVRLSRPPHSEGPAVAAEADFCLCGYIEPGRTLPEGPFGDHLGYYSLTHDFPVMTVEKVYHRRDAIWPFTVVGRPPQEDTVFGALIHEITGPVVPTLIPGVRAVHAVDAAGVHPLLLAAGTERYTPYAATAAPQEILTQANAILGQGQMSLAKYLWIAEDNRCTLDLENIGDFLCHVLARFDPRRDLHFHTRTTIDTLDYSGRGLNSGSKLVWAAVGPARRELPQQLPGELGLPAGFGEPRLCAPGVLAITAPAADPQDHERDEAAQRFCAHYDPRAPINAFPLIVLCDDSAFCAATLNNFLWVTFTRSNPECDVHGIGESIRHKHWGCTGSVVIDARIKAHHAPPLEEDPAVTARVESLAAKSGPLAGLF